MNQIVIGIPFPGAKDLRITLKKEYNNTQHIKTKSILRGWRWYSLQGYRALNQAVGRCLRHKNDFGAIFLLDGRIAEKCSLRMLPSWLEPRPLPEVNAVGGDVEAFFNRCEEKMRSAAGGGKRVQKREGEQGVDNDNGANRQAMMRATTGSFTSTTSSSSSSSSLESSGSSVFSYIA